MGAADWGRKLWLHGPEITHFLIIDFYIIETLYIPVTIVNSDHAVEASMVNYT